MPNGRRRQQNTRHANRQRQLNSVVAEPVLDEAPPVVIQAEAVPAEETQLLQQEITGMEEALDEIARQAGVPESHQRFGHYQVTIDEIEGMKTGHQRAIAAFKRMNDNKTEQINKLDDEKRTSQRVATQFMEKYEKAKAGTLLGFQEVELEDKDKEINDLTYMLEKAMDKLQEMKESEQKLLEDGRKAFFLYQLVMNADTSKGAHIHLAGKIVKVLTDQEAAEVNREVEEEKRAGSRRELTREEKMRAMGIQ